MPPQAPTAQLLQLLQLHLNYARTHLTSSEPQFFCVGKGQVVCYGLLVCHFTALHGSLNVPIEHHPTIRYMVYNGYYKVMSNIPKMGQLPTHALVSSSSLMKREAMGGRMMQHQHHNILYHHISQQQVGQGGNPKVFDFLENFEKTIKADCIGGNMG